MAQRHPSAALREMMGETAAPPKASGLTVGSAIRDRRRRLGLTLQALAKSAGLSAPFLSQLERGLASPSLVSLTGIATALGVDINYFISVPKPRHVVRRGAAPEIIETGIPVEYHRLSGKHEERKMEALLIIVPGNLSAPVAQREGEGFWYVLEGELQVTMGGESFVLGPTDSAHFDQRHPYTIANPGPTPARILWVGTPALF
ncbi:MAG: cupin domain-containing protein [Caulobacteraceae bacterium]|nr:cupin domain-containing protein [Caulobacteraceae bacterium]